MIRRIGSLLMLVLCLASLSGCVIAPAPVYGRPGGAWVPASTMAGAGCRATGPDLNLPL